MRCKNIFHIDYRPQHEKFNFKYTGELWNDQNKEQIFLNKTQKNYKVEKTDIFYYLEFFLQSQTIIQWENLEYVFFIQ